MATRAAIDAFRYTYANPGEVGAAQAAGQADRFARLWDYYSTAAYEDLALWQQYKARHALYRATRLVYSPVRRLCDLYAGIVYPGILSEDGARLPDGIAQAIPLAGDTDAGLKAAIAQFWQWSNWQAGKSVFVRYGAVAGSVLVEVVDDLARGKVTAAIRWPGLVRDLELDATGNVRAFALEFRVRAGTEAFTYRREVDRARFRTLKDGKPFAYDAATGAEWDNPYGFVPAVWAKHRDVGGDYGAPAIDGSLGKIDELNSLASHVHDQAHKKIAAPALLPGVTNLAPLTGQKRRAPSLPDGGDEYGTGTVLLDREDLLLIGAPKDADVKSLAGTLEINHALPYIERLIGEIEQDHPELTLYRELRAMSQVTGPGAQRLLGDAAARVLEAQANYDQQLIKLHAMAVAIGGWRLAAGDWGRGAAVTRHQARFAGFDLDSYGRGALDHAILPRPLVLPTQAEQWAAESARAGSVKALVEAGYALELAVARVDGLPADDPALAQFTRDRLAAIQREQALSQDDLANPGVEQ